MKLRLILIFVFLRMLNPAGAQVLDRGHAEKIGLRQGLSNGRIYQITQDQNGFLWLATENGLYRYDGNSMLVFRKNFRDKNSLLHNVVSCIAVDSRNNLWIGYGGHGLSYYDQTNSTFHHFTNDSTSKNKIPAGNTDYILIDRNDNAWLGIVATGLWQYEKKSGKFIDHGQLPYVHSGYTEGFRKHLNRLSDMYLDEKSNELWMATADGLYVFDTRTRKFGVHRPEPDTVNAWKKDVFSTFVTDSAGKFWIGGWGTGLNYFNAQTNEWRHYDPNPGFSKSYTKNIVSDICWKDKDELWVGTNDTGLCVFNIPQQKFRYPSKEERLSTGIPSFHSFRIYNDRQDNLWISYPEGLFILPVKEQTFQFIHEPVTNSDNGEYYGLSSVLIDSATGVKLTGTLFGDGLGITDLRTGKRKNIVFPILPGEERNLLVNSIYRDSRNVIWVVTRDAVFHYNPRSQKLETIPQPVPDTGQLNSPLYFDVEEDANGRVWFITGRAGILVFDTKTGKYRQINRSNSALPSNGVWSISKDRKGKFWMHTGKDVISVDQRTFEVKSFRLADYLPEGFEGTGISIVRTDYNGRLWLATSTGLFYLNTESPEIKIQTDFAKGGFRGFPVYDVIATTEDYLLFTSVNGLTVYNLKNDAVRNYSDRDGLHSMYSNLRFASAGNSSIYLFIFKGYYYFNPARIRISNITPKVFLNAFRIFDREKNISGKVSLNQRINLSPSENFFSFEFTSPDLHNSQEIMFSYRLNGFDDDWSPLTQRRFASFTNVPGGNYTFEVRAVNRDGIWSSITGVPIHVDTVFYKRPVFIALFSLVLAALIYMLYRYRIRVIQRAEQLKTKFHQRLTETEMRALRAQMNPHFIFNCLNSINRYIIKNDQKTASLYLTKFARLIRLILENSEAGMVPLSQELDALKLYIDIEALRFDNKFSYTISVDDHVQADTVLVPTMIFQPYVENAIWHGLLHKDSPGLLTISVTTDSDALLCTIEDNGIGREKAMEMQSKTSVTRKSMGLKITADRLAMLNSRAGYTKPGVEIIDLVAPDGTAIGTRVLIHIPTETD